MELPEKFIPERLYKYRPFDSRTLDLLVSDHVYYADPSNFNDPLDTRPSLKIDVNDNQLEDILSSFIETRIEAEMNAAAKIIRYTGRKTLEYIQQYSNKQTKYLIEKILCNVDDSEYDHQDVAFYLGYYIMEELVKQYDKGIIALAERADCPLMWSHYGDQHKGLCIGYSVPQHAAKDVHQVTYGGSRLIEASKVASMLARDDVARRQVDEAVLLRKAESWQYERRVAPDWAAWTSELAVGVGGSDLRNEMR